MPVTEAHDRILDTSTRLFYEEGIDIGVDRIIAAAQVTSRTLYRHFDSVDRLVAAALDRWSAQWLEWLGEQVDRGGHGGHDPQMRLTALWDALAAWFASDDFRGSLVVNAAIQLRGRPDHPGQEAIARHRVAQRQLLERLARTAGVQDPVVVALELQVLVDGAIAVAAADPRRADLTTARALGHAVVAAARAQLDERVPSVTVTPVPEMAQPAGTS